MDEPISPRILQLASALPVQDSGNRGIFAAQQTGGQISKPDFSAGRRGAVIQQMDRTDGPLGSMYSGITSTVPQNKRDNSTNLTKMHCLQGCTSVFTPYSKEK
jgi:hypothetical protein